MSPFPPRNLIVLLSAFLLSSTAFAIGDFPCAGTGDSQTCAQWSVDPNAQGNISTTAVCQPDPVNPGVSYCGYGKAACKSSLDCDYGSCGANGLCSGYLGDPCPSGPTDCQAFLFCGTDGTCGGTGAPCNNGDATSPIPSPNQQCTSNLCNLATNTCAAIPAEGMPVGSGCSVDQVCSTKYCPTSATCSIKAAQISAGGTRKLKRGMECPSGHIVRPLHGISGDAYECLDPQTDLEFCGEDGVDCTASPGVEGVQCLEGRCLVLSCSPGFALSPFNDACTSTVW